MTALLYPMGGMEGMLVGLPSAVGVLARIPGRKGVERFLRWTGLSPRGFLGLMGPSAVKVVVSPDGDEYKCCLRQRAPLVGAGQWRQCEFMAAAERKPNNRASPGGKQANRPVGRLKCTPSAAYRRRLSTGKRLTRFSGRFCSPTNHVRLPPRRGRFALHSASGLISISRHSAAKTSPSGGSTAAGGDRGAFPTGAARLYGFHFVKRNYKIHRPKGAIPQPSGQRPVKP